MVCVVVKMIPFVFISIIVVFTWIAQIGVFSSFQEAEQIKRLERLKQERQKRIAARRSEERRVGKECLL